MFQLAILNRIPFLRLAARPCTPRRAAQRFQDKEHVRHDTANVFRALARLSGQRVAAVTQQRRRSDFACFLKALVDEQAERIVLVMDQLHTHSPASLYEVSPPQQARRLARRLGIHHTHKHGAWLDRAEVELSVLRCRWAEGPSALVCWRGAYDRLGMTNEEAANAFGFSAGG